MKKLQTVLDALEHYNTTSYGDEVECIERANEAIAIVKQMMRAEPVAWIEQEWSGTGPKYLRFERRHKSVRDEVVNPIWTPLFAAPQAVPATTPPSWPKERDVGRLGDMSPNAHIRVGFDSDNDVYVSVWDENGGASSCNFARTGAGGGKSSKTRMALIALMVAMEADNADTPALDWWTRRIVRRANGDGMTHTVDTTGHCKEKAKPGGCQLHNVQCGYPKCDRQ